MPDEDSQAQEEQGFYVDGVEIDFDDLNYRERRQVRQIVADENKDVDEDEIAIDEIEVATLYVVKKRTDESITLEQVREMTPSEVHTPPKKAKARKRPTKAAS